MNDITQEKFKELRRQSTILPDELSFDNIVGILEVGFLKRSARQMMVLREFTRQIKFFQNLVEENGKFLHFAACERLCYEFVQAGKMVFEYKSYGNKFYVVLKGRVGVWVPRVVEDVEEFTKVAVLESGDSFGELALIKDQLRSASIVCEADTHFATLSKEDYMSILGKYESRKLSKLISFLQKIPTFSQWTKKKLEGLSLYMSKKHFVRKQEVFHINSAPDHVYIVTEGEFELTKPIQNASKKYSFTIKVALLSKGEVFGDSEVMKKIPYSHTCKCYSTKGTLLCIKAQDFNLKVYSQEFINEFKKNENTKNMLRSSRMEGFKNYLEFNDEVLDKKDEVFPRMLVATPNPKKVFKSELRRFTNKEIFLSADKIKRIKQKALGRVKDKQSPVSLTQGKSILRIFTDFSQVDTTIKPSTRLAESSKKFTMKHHRPGGYFLGKFKKSWKGLKVLTPNV